MEASHVSLLRWLRRLSPLESTYPKEQAVPVCVETCRTLGFDLEALLLPPEPYAAVVKLFRAGGAADFTLKHF